MYDNSMFTNDKSIFGAVFGWINDNFSYSHILRETKSYLLLIRS